MSLEDCRRPEIECIRYGKVSEIDELEPEPVNRHSYHFHFQNGSRYRQTLDLDFDTVADRGQFILFGNDENATVRDVTGIVDSPPERGVGNTDLRIQRSTDMGSSIN
ncbi:hypothetical protein RE428_21600 [Marinobacter nanhaiticus D15-8W]|nr:hypothetical protein RE428_21600 [Marinobacter nanhaiticus D15-8W]